MEESAEGVDREEESVLGRFAHRVLFSAGAVLDG